MTQKKTKKKDAAGFDIVYLCVRGLGCLLVPDSL
jgi:hypothetical protein